MNDYRITHKTQKGKIKSNVVIEDLNTQSAEAAFNNDFPTLTIIKTVKL